MRFNSLQNPTPSAAPNRFVLLEHRWNGVHWDLMLEAGDRLRTWALTHLPVPGINIGATSLPDHRVVYLDYEGPISNDRGTVLRIDRGTYHPILWTEDRVVIQLFGDQVIGEAELVRLGDRGWRFRIGNLI
ncbi:DNA polymerase ligase N-terminal domain-containing protein [Tautonia rosea]|uniref:DNA polymerase ligase N-terminal domain-containing protein n=1 Tax=Tautonia rosea TaxID=2728037 RepID=UPI001472B4DB|nr:DNA polymerase ligase N-terminal domain-containing protein [Tautonia rosea]